MKKRLLYLAIMLVIVSSMMLLSGCVDTSNMAGSTVTATEKNSISAQESKADEEEVFGTEADEDEVLEAEADEEEVLAAEAAVGYDEMVWIPRTGSKYHSNPDCSRMKDPSHVTLSEAESRGYTPCSKCY